MGRALPKQILILAMAIVPLPGCFQYVPTTLEAVPEGQEIQLFVTREGLSETEGVAENGQPIVRGRLVSREDDRLFIRVPTTVRREGFHQAVLGQDVAIPISEIVQVERREVDRLGTGMLVAGTAGVAATVIFVIMEAVGGDDPDPGDGTDEARIPLFSIPLR